MESSFPVHRVGLPIEERFSFLSSKEDVNELPAVDEGPGFEDEVVDYFKTFRDVFAIEEGTELVIGRVEGCGRLGVVMSDWYTGPVDIRV